MIHVSKMIVLVNHVIVLVDNEAMTKSQTNVHSHCQLVQYFFTAHEFIKELLQKLW